ncbi:MAG: hypothetical protein ACPIOQ_83730, partial [Promethearchaeia archaeon]
MGQSTFGTDPAHKDSSVADSNDACFSIRSQSERSNEEGSSLLAASCCRTFSREASSPTEAPRMS